MDKDTIVQMPSAQLPRILCLTTFSNHIEILNRCKTLAYPPIFLSQVDVDTRLS